MGPLSVMDLLSKLTNRLPFGKKKELSQYYFALKIGSDHLTAALWSLEGTKLQVLESASAEYKSEDLVGTTDALLDKVLGIRQLVVEKILFGVPQSWLLDDDLKEEYLNLLRSAVKELELQPMAYVATSHALIHFLEKQENVPTTAILVGIESNHLAVTVTRAGKLDGTKILTRSSNIGVDIEKALLTFTQVETLPSKILIFASGIDFGKLEKIKNELLSYQWMSKLSFLHFPKIEILDEDIEINSICFAGGFEINNNVTFSARLKSATVTKPLEEMMEGQAIDHEEEESQNIGFVVGDVSEREKRKGESESVEEGDREKEVTVAEELQENTESNLKGENEEVDNLDYQQKAIMPQKDGYRFPFKVWENLLSTKFIPRSRRKILLLSVVILIILGILSAYLFVPKAQVKVFVEPKILEKQSEITADPKQKTADQDKKIIPGQIVETEISGSDKGQASGTKEIGDPAKGVVAIRNKTDQEKKLSKGTILTSAAGLKFILDTTVSIASRSAEDGTYGKATADVVAQNIGAEGNLPSGTDLTIANFSQDQLIAKSEGNFSGGTSKKVTVVSDVDQKKLLSQVVSNLRKQAQQKLQEKLPDKKVLEEALAEQIVKKNFSKNINDQAAEFSLNLTVNFKGTAFDDKDLKQIVSQLVTTEVPEGYEFSLQDSETQSDVSKLEDDGRLIFLARFKAKLIPKLDTDKIKRGIRGRPLTQAVEILKGIDNILDAEITISLPLPQILQIVPFFEKNIKVEVGVK